MLVPLLVGLALLLPHAAVPGPPAQQAVTDPPAKQAADDADIDYAVAACTGLYYSLHLAGTRIAKNWPERTAALIWAAIGGTTDS